MQSKLFRKAALDRLSSPEQLDQMMQITNSKGWLALIALAILLGAAAIWAIFGRIPTTVDVEGILVDSGGTAQASGAPAMEAVIFVPLANAADIIPGLDVEVSPMTIRQAQYGFIRGRIKSVANAVATTDDLHRILGRDELVQTVSAEGIVVEVHVELLPDSTTASGYDWSSQSAAGVQLQVGTPCLATVTIREEAPINSVFPVPSMIWMPQ